MSFPPALVQWLTVLTVPLGATAISGVLSTDTEYGAGDSPLVIDGTLGVAPGVTLTLRPGLEVLCAAVTCVQLLGRLEVQGSASDPVTFSCEAAGCAAEGAWITILDGDEEGKGLTVNHAVFNGASSPLCSVTAVRTEHSSKGDNEYQTSVFTDVVARCVKFITGGGGPQTSSSGVQGLQFKQGDFQYVEFLTEYPRPAKIEIEGSKIRDSTIDAESYSHRGMHLLDCNVSGSSIRIGCCSSLLRISDSRICDSTVRDYNDYWDMVIRGSSLTNTPVTTTRGGSLTIEDTTLAFGASGALDLEGDLTLDMNRVALLGGGGGTALRLGRQGTKQISRTLVYHFSTAVYYNAIAGQLTVTASNFIGIGSLLFQNVGSADVSVSSCFFDTDQELHDVTVDQRDALSYGVVSYTQVRQSASDEPPQAPPPPGSVSVDVGGYFLVGWGAAQGAESYVVSLWVPPSDESSPCTAFGEPILTKTVQVPQVSVTFSHPGASSWVCAVQAQGAGGTSWHTFEGSGVLPPPSPSPGWTPSPSSLSPSPSPWAPSGGDKSDHTDHNENPHSAGGNSDHADHNEQHASEAPPTASTQSAQRAESGPDWLVPVAAACGGALLALCAGAASWLLMRRRLVLVRSRPLEAEAEVPPVPVAVMETQVDEELRPPANWRQANASGWTNAGSTTLVEVDGLEMLGLQELLDKTFRKVRTRDRKTGPMPERLEIISVQRVENTELWQRYAASRRALKSKRAHKCTPVGSRGGLVRTMESRALGKIMMDTVNEVYLWHGTSEAGATSIVQSGFKVELAGSSAGTLYGKGVYMAECSSKADEYAVSDDAMPGVRCLLLCRTALGEILSLTAGGEATYAMIEAGISSGAYDSVLGDREASVGTYREFVVYDSSRIYPEYIIHYEHEPE